MNYSWDWFVFFRQSVTGEGFYWQMILRGLGWTMVLSLASWVLALAIGTMAGIARTVRQPLARWVAAAYVHCFRNTPLLVQLFIWYFVIPELLPVRWGDAIKAMDPVWNQFLTVLVALTLYSGAKAAEQVRAGIESVPRGQAEAAMALGLTAKGVYRYVVLPQAFRIVIPPMTSDFLNVFKNSAVALTIGLMELTGQTRQLSEFSSQPFEAFVAATLIYMAITYVVILGMRAIERRSRVPGLLGA